MTLSRKSCIHEAAHAVAARRYGFDVYEVRVYDGGGGVSRFRGEPTDEQFAQIAGAGRAAELEGGYGMTEGPRDDFERIAETLPSWRSTAGGLAAATERAGELVATHWDAIERVADALERSSGYLAGSALEAALRLAVDDEPTVDPAIYAHQAERRRLFESEAVGRILSDQQRKRLWEWAGQKAAGEFVARPELPVRHVEPKAPAPLSPMGDSPATAAAGVGVRSREPVTASGTDWYIATHPSDPRFPVLVRMIEQRMAQQTGVAR